MSNPRRRRRARRRHLFRNPRLNVRGIVRETLIPAAIGAGGAVALDIAYAYATPVLPAALQSGVLPVAVKLAGAIALGMIAGKVAGSRTGQAVTLGAVTVVAYGAVRGALSTALPTVKGLSGMEDYVDYSVGARTMGALMPRTLGFVSPAPTLGALMPRAGAPVTAPSMHGLNAMSDYDWRNDGM